MLIGHICNVTEITFRWHRPPTTWKGVSPTNKHLVRGARTRRWDFSLARGARLHRIKLEESEEQRRKGAKRVKGVRGRQGRKGVKGGSEGTGKLRGPWKDKEGGGWMQSFSPHRSLILHIAIRTHTRTRTRTCTSLYFSHTPPTHHLHIALLH